MCVDGFFFPGAKKWEEEEEEEEEVSSPVKLAKTTQRMQKM